MTPDSDTGTGSRRDGDRDKSPKDLGFAAPGEWWPHRRTWMAWPNPSSEWPDYDGAQRAFAQVMAAVAEFEPLSILCRPSQLEEVRRVAPGDAEVHITDLDDAWMRDIGPTFLIAGDGSRLGVDWTFNSWGGKWAWQDDDRAAQTVLRHAGVERYRTSFVFEGGAVHFDGEGTLLTTRQCALDHARNPGLDEAQVTRILCETLGADHVVWLDQGLVDDHTDGHIDELACFAAPGRVLLAGPSGPGDPNVQVLAAARRDLEQARDARGRVLEITNLPLPEPRRHEGAFLTLSYLNFYLVNGGLVLPSFGQPAADDRARGLLAEQFPDRQVRTVDASALVLGGGGIHCITQQEPEAVE